MTIASRTELMQMRFVRAGAPFCSIGAKSSIVKVGFYSKGTAFYPTTNEITPPTYSYLSVPIRRGSNFINKVGNSSVDAHYGFTTDGGAFYVPFSGTSTYPTYSSALSQRRGTAFANITAKSTIDAHFGKISQGKAFYVPFSGTSTYTPYTNKQLRQGRNFLNITAKASIDASGFDFYQRGEPFYIPSTNVVVTYKASQFFMMF